MTRSEIRGLGIRLIASLPFAVAMVLLAGCNTNAPAHTNSWLSYGFFQRGCNLTNCPDLVDQNEEVTYYCTIAVTGGNAQGGVSPAQCAADDPARDNDGNLVVNLDLFSWKFANGFRFDQPGAHAEYGNLSDLRIGRDMHCIQNGQNIACYVDNYGPSPAVRDANDRWTTNASWSGISSDDLFSSLTFTFPLLHEAVLAATKPGTGLHHVSKDPFATVAMVYNPGATANQVTFYAFDSGGRLLTHYNDSPALDGEGPKTNPRMCMACHGGAYDAATHSVSGAKFLPFDVYAFELPSRDGYTLDDQQEDLRKLNALVKLTNPNQAITEFIDGLYPGGVTNQGSTAVDGYVPAGWSGQEKLYNGVVRQYCRMCHLGQSNSFNSYQEFRNAARSIEEKVCQTYDMPNAQVPFELFWRDALARDDLRAFLKGEGITDLHGCK